MGAEGTAMLQGSDLGGVSPGGGGGGFEAVHLRRQKSVLILQTIKQEMPKEPKCHRAETKQTTEVGQERIFDFMNYEL